MGLLISLYLPESDEEGGLDDFYLNDTRVVLDSIEHKHNFKLRVVGSALDEVLRITDKHATLAIPDVMISAGNPTGSRTNEVKVYIEAPKKVKILRGAVYRNEHEDK